MRIVLLCSLIGCTASGDSVAPPVDELFFPTGAAVAPDERVLFVANANSDLRYNAGTISVIDLELVDQTIASWVGPDQIVPAGCARDPDHVETLICDEAMFVITDAVAGTGSFATAIAVQDRGGGRARLIVPTRGDPSVAWLDWDGQVLDCGTSEVCDDTHRLAAIEGIGFLPGDPFDVAVDPVGQFAVVSHFTSGTVTLIDSPSDGNATIADVTFGLFNSDADGNVGASGLAIRPGEGGGIIYVGSQYEDRIQMLTVGRPVNGAPPYLLQAGFFFLDGAGDNAGLSVDTRALVFGDEGRRLYNVNRNPPTLQEIDTSLSAAGFPNNEFGGVHDICRIAERASVVDTGDGPRIYVSCFQDGQLYVIDPVRPIADVVTVGRGAFDVAAATTRGRVYVTNTLEDTIAVLDVVPGSPLRNRVVLRIGTPRD